MERSSVLGESLNMIKSNMNSLLSNYFKVVYICFHQSVLLNASRMVLQIEQSSFWPP